MLLGVQVEHPGDQRALQAGAVAVEHVEARAAELDAAFEVDHAEGDAEFVVHFCGEGQRRGGTGDGAEDDVVVFVRADRRARVEHIGQRRGEVGELRLDAAEVGFEGRDLVADRAHFGFARVAFGWVAHAADFLADGIAGSAECFALGEDFAALHVEGEDGVERIGIAAAGGEHGADGVGFLADEVNVEHGFSGISKNFRTFSEFFGKTESARHRIRTTGAWCHLNCFSCVR